MLTKVSPLVEYNITPKGKTLFELQTILKTELVKIWKRNKTYFLLFLKLLINPDTITKASPRK